MKPSLMFSGANELKGTYGALCGGSEVRSKILLGKLVFCATLVCLLSLGSTSAFAQLDENCTVSILNRSVQADPDGLWKITNLPIGFGPVVARAVCVKNGQTSFGRTGAYTLNHLQTTGYDATITLGPSDLAPERLSISSSITSLSSVSQVTQASVFSRLPDGTTRDVTAATSGTVYLTSNPAIATVSTNGLITATGVGAALISAINDGVTAILTIKVARPIDSDGDGIVDDKELELGLNPNNPLDALEDPDADGLTNLDESRLGTDIRSSDSDGDRIPDGFEVQLQLNPLSPNTITRVQGFVRDVASAPVPNALVSVFGLFNASTDATGAFQILNVPAQLGALSVTTRYLGGPLLSGTSAPTTPVPSSLTDVGVITVSGNSAVLSGVVRNSQNQPVAGAQVSLSSGLMTIGVTTNATGNYSATVLAGAVTAVAFDAASGLRASRSVVVQNNIAATLDLTLSNSGTITGTVFRFGGQTPAARVPVSVTSGPGTLQTVTDAFGRYSVDAVATGAITVDVSDSATGDRGRATTSLAGNGSVQNANVTFNGVGSVVVTVKTGANPVANATVVLTSTTPFGGQQTATTQADGTATFASVLAGSFSVIATHPTDQRTTNTTNTAIAGNSVAVALAFESTGGAGSVSGILYQNDSVTPIAGREVRLLNFYGSVVDRATTSAAGGFLFSAVAAGLYHLDATAPDGRILAREQGLSLTGAESISRNLTAVAVGSIAGLVKNPDGSAAATVPVEVRSLNRTVGGIFSAVTSATGTFSINNVPVGDFDSSASDTNNNLLAEAVGVVTGAAAANVTLQLASSVTSLPATRFDANNNNLELQSDLSLGPASIFNSALALDVTVAGVTQRFSGVAPVKSLGGRQLTASQTLGGLQVSRHVYVPRDGYFARYLEVFRNPTAAPVTVGAQISSEVQGWGPKPGGVLETSSGGSLLNVAGSNPDRWTLYAIDDSDDYGQTLGFLFDGPSASVHASNATRLVGDPGTVSYQWSGLTVPPGGSVAILHFIVRQYTRASARSSVSRLAQLPPESLAGLSATQVSAVSNFSIPPGAASFLTPLPPINGSINGKVWNYSQTTAIPNVNVTIQTQSPFFPGYFPLTSDVNGNFSITSQLRDDGSSTVIPAGPFRIYANTPNDGVTRAIGGAATVDGDFVQGQTSITKNVVFSNTGILQLSQTYPSGAPGVGSATVIPQDASLSQITIPLTNGQGSIPVLRPGNYTVSYRIRHPQSIGNYPLADPNRVATDATPSQLITIAASQATSPGNVFPSMGNVTGIVRTADGSVASGFWVRGGPDGYERWTTTSATGEYTLFDIPAGPTTVFARDNSAFGSLIDTGRQQVTVVGGQTATRNLQISGYGVVTVTVKYPDATPVVGASVVLRSVNTSGTSFLSGTSNAEGVATFEGVGPGTISARASLGNERSATPWVSGTLDQTGVASLALILDLGSVSGHITKPDGSVAVGSRVEIGFDLLFDPPDSRWLSAVADASGGYTISGIPRGVPFILRIWRADNFAFRDLMNQTLSANPTTIIDGIVPVAATLRVTTQASDGSVAPNTRLLFENDRRQFERRTDQAGVALVGGIHEGSYTVRGVNPDFSFFGSSGGAITVAQDGTTVDVLVRRGYAGSIRGTIFAADGVTPVPFISFDVLDEATGLSLTCPFEICSPPSTDESGNYSVDSISAGSLGFRVVAGVGAGTVVGFAKGSITAPGQFVTANVITALSVVKGTVFLSDGSTPVPNPNVFAQQGNDSFYGTSDSSGRFVVFGVVPGPFTLLAQDPAGPLTGTAPGTLLSGNSAVLNVIMSPSGAVSGTVKDAAGQALNAALVGASSEISSVNSFNVTMLADSQGRYQFTRLPVGTVVVQGQDPATGVARLGSAALTNGGPPAQLDITLPSTASIQGAVFAQNGSSRSANANISVQTLTSNGPLGGYHNVTTADGSGNYQLAGVPIGPVRAIASDASNTALIGIGDASLLLSPTNINVLLGNAVQTGRVDLDGGDGFRYSFDCLGQLVGGGTADGRLRSPYSYAYAPPSLFPCLGGATVTNAGRQLGFGPVSAGAIVVSRSVFVPTSGKFARYLETLGNPSATPATVTFNINGVLDSGGQSRLLVAPSANANRYAVTGTDGGCCFPVTAHVFAGAGGSVSANTPVFQDLRSQFGYGWTVTIPAGQSVSLLHFAVQRDSSDAGGAGSQAQALVSLSDPDALAGLGAADRAKIVNFNLP
jgi:large repetitive protein